jgi:predicted ArsR family transcriptional regulator
VTDVMPEGRYAALAVPSRRRLLDILRAADSPMDAASLAEAVGLHLTTTRFHLDVLEQARLVHRFVDRGGRPGRPRVLYQVVAEGSSDQSGSEDRYQELAAVLAEALGGEPDLTRQRAEDAGRRWAETQVPVQDLSWEDGTRQLTDVFVRLGFAPRVVDDRDGRHVELTACPFREVARAHPQVVCAVHAGLLQGTLSRLSVPEAQQAGIRPFVAPDLCIVDLPPRGGTDSSSSPPAS